MFFIFHHWTTFVESVITKNVLAHALKTDVCQGLNKLKYCALINWNN